MNALPQKSGVRGQKMGVFRLNPRIAPPLGLLAPWGIDKRIHRADPLRVNRSAVNSVQHLVGTTERAGNLHRIYGGAPGKFQFQRMLVFANDNAHVADAHDLIELAPLPLRSGNHAGGKRDQTAASRLRLKTDASFGQPVRIEQIENKPRLRAFVFQNRRSRKPLIRTEVECNTAQTPCSGGGNFTAEEVSLFMRGRDFSVVE